MTTKNHSMYDFADLSKKFNAFLNDIKVFPNPINNLSNLTLEFEPINKVDNYVCKLFNKEGKFISNVWNGYVDTSKNTIKFKSGIAELINGTYFLAFYNINNSLLGMKNIVFLK